MGSLPRDSFLTSLSPGRSGLGRAALRSSGLVGLPRHLPGWKIGRASRRRLPSGLRSAQRPSQGGASGPRRSPPRCRPPRCCRRVPVGLLPRWRLPDASQYLKATRPSLLQPGELASSGGRTCPRRARWACSGPGLPRRPEVKGVRAFSTRTWVHAQTNFSESCGGAPRGAGRSRRGSGSRCRRRGRGSRGRRASSPWPSPGSSQLSRPP